MDYAKVFGIFRLYLSSTAAAGVDIVMYPLRYYWDDVNQTVDELFNGEHIIYSQELRFPSGDYSTTPLEGKAYGDLFGRVNFQRSGGVIFTAVGGQTTVDYSSAPPRIEMEYYHDW
jgi:hypothetical protein